MNASTSRLVDAREWPYLAAAALMTSFDPTTLRGMGVDTSDRRIILEMLMQSAETVAAGPAKGRWKLRDAIRRQVLAELSQRQQLKSAVDANADASGKALLTMVESSRPIPLRGLGLNELLALLQAQEWLLGAGLLAEPHPDLARCIEREQFLEPLRRLTVGFQGRDNDLRALREYVDALASESAGEMLFRGVSRLKTLFSSRPPLVIHGPGGAGKSTLIAEFILRHLDRKSGPPMPFIRLDFDRATLDPSNPDELLLEAVSQLSRQFPDQEGPLGRIAAQVRARFASEDSQFAAESGHYSQSNEARRELSRVMNSIAKSSGEKILFVIDTFEIVQRRGQVAVYSLLDFVGRFLDDVPSLRVVIAGRAELKVEQFEFGEVISWAPYRLLGFDTQAGRAYLRSRLKALRSSASVSDEVLDRVVFVVRGNPLALRLAAQVVAREGGAGIEATIGNRALDDRIADEQIQGMLHTRIIEHLDNDDLKRIASPGLIVRRITEDVIREVLAGPCELNLQRSSPEQLFSLLKNEFSLVEAVDDKTLRHRSDVRELMLGALRRDLGSLARQVDDLAVTFWSGRSDHASRAEEIYHRLWRGDAREDLDPLWMPGLEDYLQDAADEMEIVKADDWARIWLCERLGRDLPPELRQRSGQVNWERDTERRARALLSDGKPALVLQVIAERPTTTWLRESPLWSIVADSHLLMGNLDRAISIINEGLVSAVKASVRHRLELMARRVSVLEQLGDTAAAQETAESAMALARTAGDKRAVFMTGLALARLTLARLTRRAGASDASFMELRKELAQLSTDPAVQRALRRSPSLLRDAAARLGDAAPGIVADALDRLGYEMIVSGKDKFDPGWTMMDVNPSGLASRIRDGKLKPSLVNDIAGFYGEVARSLTSQILS